MAAGDANHPYKSGLFLVIHRAQSVFSFLFAGAVFLDIDEYICIYIAANAAAMSSSGSPEDR
jgi:hypothetical protein